MTGACASQVRLAAAEERAARAEWEGRDAAQAAARELAAARARRPPSWRAAGPPPALAARRARAVSHGAVPVWD